MRADGIPTTVEVAHQDGVGLVADQTPKEGELMGLGAPVERKVGDHDQQPVGLLAEAGDQRTPARDPAGQADFTHLGRTVAAEQAHAVLCPGTETAVDARMPEWEVRLVCQIGDLVDVVAAQAAGIGFL